MDFDPYHQEVLNLSSGAPILVKKEVKKGRNVGKNLTMCSGRRGIKKWDRSPWGFRKGPKKILGKFFFEKVEEE